jgi:ectoine hydroxylase
MLSIAEDIRIDPDRIKNVSLFFVFIIILMKFFEKYTGQLRTFKVLYSIYNFLNWKKLKQNSILYKKYGIKKSIYGSISNKDFSNLKGVAATPWLDQINADHNLNENKLLNTFPLSLQEKIKEWPKKGYMVLENYVSPLEADAVNEEIDILLKDKEVDFNYTNKKIMFAFLQSKRIKEIVYTPDLLKLLSFIMGREVIPFQTINFLKGSEQKAHSDSIHMTTFPLGYLVAVWIALEDTHVKNGPLFYFKGSHKLPYILNENFESGSTEFRIGNSAYKKYEEKIQQVIVDNKLQKEDFYAKKGDVFIWHANLLHGGNPVLDAASSRKSMVVHYFCKDVICYHELTQRPALFSNYPTASLQVFDKDE